MSRNGSGTYTLPAGNPVVTGTTIESNWANTTLSDIATTLTDSLSRSGQGGMTAALRLADGTQGAPGLGFANETGSGLYRAGTGEVWAVVQGAQTLNLDASGVTVPADKATSIEGTFVFNETGADKDARFEGDTDANLLFIDASTDRVGVGTNSPSNKLTVSGNADVTGNLGVGTSSPSALIHAKKDQTSATYVMADNNGTINANTSAGFACAEGGSITAFFRALRDGTGEVQLYNVANASFLLGTNNTERVRISAAGNVGIGTNTPTAKLDVSGDASLNGAVIINEAGADKDTRIEGDTDANLVFVDASTDKVGIGTNAPTEKLTVNGGLQATSFNSGQLAGMRNKIINGAMGIDQRNAGAAQTITAAAALAYTVDRWYAYCTGANVTGQRVSGTAPNQFNYRFTGAASVTKIGFAQRIEAANSQDLAGATATLSVDLANSVLTTVTWTAWYANSADTFGTLASPTRTQIATGTFTVSSTLARYNTQISIPGAATTGIEVEFSVAAQTSGTWTIGRAQLEVGGVATPFEHRLFGEELMLCQRYYERIGETAQWPSFSGNATTSANVTTSCYWKVTKRAAPTVTKFGTWLVSNCGQPSVDSANVNGCRVVFQITSTGYAVTEPNSADDYIEASIEL